MNLRTREDILDIIAHMHRFGPHQYLTLTRKGSRVVLIRAPYSRGKWEALFGGNDTHQVEKRINSDMKINRIPGSAKVGFDESGNISLDYYLPGSKIMADAVVGIVKFPFRLAFAIFKILAVLAASFVIFFIFIQLLRIFIYNV